MCGCHEYGYYLVRGLLQEKLPISYFVILNPEHNARYKISGYCDLRGLADEFAIPVYEPVDYSLTHPKDVAFFETQRFDILIQGGWQRLFPQQVLGTLRVGAIGVHGSADFLPKGRGRSPLNWSLIEGKKRFLLQLFLMRAGADDGDVFDWESFDINEFDTIRTLYFKNIILSRRMLLRSIPRIADRSIRYHPQKGISSHYLKRTPDDGEIRWEDMDVWYIYNLIRATTRPYPGVFAPIEGITHRIWRAQVFDSRIVYPGAGYGEIVERFDNLLVINCRGGLLLVEDYERAD
jgi:methionyl-tRNA formyltransferase